ncbi:MAG: HEAT repeat domain-containing protein [Candidatus Omnitrophica bacterium]|nr:HEAT repeat domain-containing protein [Candidatus Omnitrophota bacterium]
MQASAIPSSKRLLQWVLAVFFLGLPLVLSSCTPVDENMAKKSVDQLIVDLKNSEGLIRAKAALALGAKGVDARDAVPYLVKGLTDSKPYVRNRMVDALGKIGEPSVPALIEVNVNSKDRSARFFSAMALKKIPTDQAQEAYKAYMDREGKKILKTF